MACRFGSICNFDEPSAYWCFYNFLNARANLYGDQVQSHFLFFFPFLIFFFPSFFFKATATQQQLEVLSSLLKNHEPELCQHFQDVKLSIDHFSTNWLEGCFASELSRDAVERLWEKMIGISPDFIVCFALVLIQSLKQEILGKSDAKSILDIFGKVCGKKRILQFSCLLCFSYFLLLGGRKTAERKSGCQSGATDESCYGLLLVHQLETSLAKHVCLVFSLFFYFFSV
jgi:hypothetical protein